MRLLAATRSIINMRDGRSPYEMRPENLLPRFGPLLRAASTAMPPTQGPDGRQGIGTTERTEKTMKTVVVDSQVEQQEQAVEPVAAYPQGRWTFWRNRFNTGAENTGAATPSAATAAEAPEQGELLLDTVKVVRNDLSDEPNTPPTLATRPKQDPAGRPAPAQNTEGTGFLWNRITSRFFGAGRSPQ